MKVDWKVFLSHVHMTAYDVASSAQNSEQKWNRIRIRGVENVDFCLGLYALKVWELLSWISDALREGSRKISESENWNLFL